MDACKEIKITVGDLFQGTLQLRKSVNGVVNPYPIPSGAKIEVHFPAADSAAPVVLSTLNAGEITVVDPNLSTISYLGSPAKSLLLNPALLQQIDIVVTDVSGNPYTFTSGPILNIANRANN